MGGIRKKKFNLLCLKVCLNLDSILVTWIYPSENRLGLYLDLKHDQTISPVWNVKKKKSYAEEISNICLFNL